MYVNHTPVTGWGVQLYTNIPHIINELSQLVLGVYSFLG